MIGSFCRQCKCYFFVSLLFAPWLLEISKASLSKTKSKTSLSASQFYVAETPTNKNFLSSEVSSTIKRSSYDLEGTANKSLSLDNSSSKLFASYGSSTPYLSPNKWVSSSLVYNTNVSGALSAGISASEDRSETTERNAQTSTFKPVTSSSPAAHGESFEARGSSTPIVRLTSSKIVSSPISSTETRLLVEKVNHTFAFTNSTLLSTKQARSSVKIRQNSSSAATRSGMLPAGILTEHRVLGPTSLASLNITDRSSLLSTARPFERNIASNSNASSVLVYSPTTVSWSSSVQNVSLFGNSPRVSQTSLDTLLQDNIVVSTSPEFIIMKSTRSVLSPSFSTTAIRESIARTEGPVSSSLASVSVNPTNNTLSAHGASEEVSCGTADCVLVRTSLALGMRQSLAEFLSRTPSSLYGSVIVTASERPVASVYHVLNTTSTVESVPVASITRPSETLITHSVHKAVESAVSLMTSSNRHQGERTDLTNGSFTLTKGTVIVSRSKPSMSTTVEVLPSAALPWVNSSYRVSNSSNEQYRINMTNASNLMPFSKSPSPTLLQQNITSVDFLRTQNLASSLAENLTKNPSLSSTKTSLRATKIHTTSETTMSKNSQKITTTSSVKEHLENASSASVSVATLSTEAPVFGTERESAVTTTSQLSVSSQMPNSNHMFSFYTPKPSFVHQIRSSSGIKSFATPLLDKSSTTVSNIISNESTSRGVRSSPQQSFSDTNISSKVKTPGLFSPIMSLPQNFSLSNFATYPLFSTTTKRVIASLSSYDLYLSKRAGYSVVPIYKPCFISYVITITQSIVEPRSSATTLQNSGSSNDPLNPTSSFMTSIHSYSSSLRPMPFKTTRLLPVTSKTLSTSENRVQTYFLSTSDSPGPTRLIPQLTLNSTVRSFSASTKLAYSPKLTASSNESKTTSTSAREISPSFVSTSYKESKASLSTSKPWSQNPQSLSGSEITETTSGAPSSLPNRQANITLVPSDDLTASGTSHSSGVTSPSELKNTGDYSGSSCGPATATIPASQTSIWTHTPRFFSGIVAPLSGTRSLFSTSSMLANSSGVDIKMSSQEEKAVSTPSSLSQSLSTHDINSNYTSPSVSHNTTESSVAKSILVISSSYKVKMAALNSSNTMLKQTIDKSSHLLRNISFTLANSYPLSTHPPSRSTSQSIANPSLPKLTVFSTTSSISNSFTTTYENRSSDEATHAPVTQSTLVPNIGHAKSYISSGVTSTIVVSILPSPVDSQSLSRNETLRNFTTPHLPEDTRTHSLLKLSVSFQPSPTIGLSTVATTELIFSKPASIRARPSSFFHTSVFEGNYSNVISLSVSSHESSVHHSSDTSVASLRVTPYDSLSSVTVATSIPLEYAGTVLSLPATHHSRPSGSTMSVGQQVYDSTSVNKKSSSSHDPSTAFTAVKEALSSKSSIMFASSSRTSFYPSSESVLPEPTRSHQRKRREIGSYPLLLNETNTNPVRNETINPYSTSNKSTVLSKRPSDFLDTMTSNIRSSLTSVLASPSVNKSSFLKPSDVFTGKEMFGTTVSKTPSLTLAITPTNDHISDATLFHESKKSISLPWNFGNSSHIFDSTSTLEVGSQKQLHLNSSGSSSFQFSLLPDISLPVLTSEPSVDTSAITSPASHDSNRSDYSTVIAPTPPESPIPQKTLFAGTQRAVLFNTSSLVYQGNQTAGVRPSEYSTIPVRPSPLPRLTINDSIISLKNITYSSFQQFTVLPNATIVTSNSSVSTATPHDVPGRRNTVISLSLIMYSNFNSTYSTFLQYPAARISTTVLPNSVTVSTKSFVPTSTPRNIPGPSEGQSDTAISSILVMEPRLDRTLASEFKLTVSAARTLIISSQNILPTESLGNTATEVGSLNLETSRLSSTTNSLASSESIPPLLPSRLFSLVSSYVKASSRASSSTLYSSSNFDPQNFAKTFTLNNGTPNSSVSDVLNRATKSSVFDMSSFKVVAPFLPSFPTFANISKATFWPSDSLPSPNNSDEYTIMSKYSLLTQSQWKWIPTHIAKHSTSVIVKQTTVSSSVWPSQFVLLSTMVASVSTIESVTLASMASLYSRETTSWTSLNVNDKTSSSAISSNATTIYPSPSPSFLTRMRGNVTSTPKLSVINVLPSQTLSKTGPVSAIYSSMRSETVHSGFAGTTEDFLTGVGSAVQSSMLLLSSPPMLNTSSLDRRMSSEISHLPGPRFTFYLIPTSSLGMCVVGYSTIVLAHSENARTTGILGPPYNTTSESLLSSTKPSSSPTSVTSLEKNITMINNRSSFATSILLQLPSSSSTFTPESSLAVLSRINTAAVISRINTTAVTSRINTTAVISRMNTAAVISRINTTAVTSRINTTAVISRINTTAVTSRINTTAVEVSTNTDVQNFSLTLISTFSWSSASHEFTVLSRYTSSDVVSTLPSPKLRPTFVTSLQSSLEQPTSVTEGAKKTGTSSRLMSKNSSSISGISVQGTSTKETAGISEISVQTTTTAQSGISERPMSTADSASVSGVLLQTTPAIESASTLSLPSISALSGKSVFGISVERTSTPVTASTSGIFSVDRISPSLSSSQSISSPSSAILTNSTPTGSPPGNEDSLLLISLNVPGTTDVTTNQFKNTMEEKLNDVYIKGRLVESRRRKRATSDTSVKVKNIKRIGEKVDITYLVLDNNKTVPAESAAETMNIFTIAKLSSLIGYDVLSRPEPVDAPRNVPTGTRNVPTGTRNVPTDNIVAMLIKTISQSNVSLPLNKKALENELANFYKSSRKGPQGQDTQATITYTYFEPLNRTYLEFVIIVDNVTVNQSIVQEVFDVRANELTDTLKQVVLVTPYIPGLFTPGATDYIIQNMQFNNVSDLKAIKGDLSTKLSRVYLAAKGKASRKRKKRAIGSIDSVITQIRRTEGSLADVTYYIIDGGSVLNATYASAVLNKLTTNEMTLITTPFIVNSSPTPVQPSTGQTSDNDEYPSWMIPVIVAGSVGLLLLIIIIIVYCRWKKGAPGKKIQPGIVSGGEKELQRPKMTYTANPNENRDLYRAPTPRTAVTVEGNGTGPREGPPTRKLPVREASVRRKVYSRESLVTSQTTRSNPAYVEESGDESVIDTNTVQSRRLQTKAQIVPKKALDVPRKQEPPPSIAETLESEASEGEESEGDSVYSAKDSVFTANTDQHSAAALLPVAVMSDTRPPQQPTPVKFRSSVHPAPSLPPLELKQTSLVGRVVDEEGPIQKQMKNKADIERWRNKQRQREKKLGETQNKPGNRPSFTEKKAWSRAQQEIGSVLYPEAMQPIVRKKKRKPRRKYEMKTETTDDEENIELKSFNKLKSPREEKIAEHEKESQSDSDISLGEARRRMIALLDDAFSALKATSKRHATEKADHVDGSVDARTRANYSPAGYRPPLYPRPVASTPALPEPPPAHGRATAPSARHRRRLLNSQSSLPYPSHYYPRSSGGYSPGYPLSPPVVTRSPVVVWDPADKQRLLNQSSYKPYPGHAYTYSDPSGKLHVTPVQRTPDGMGGLVWSPYATEYAMEDLYRNVGMPGSLDDKNAGFLSQLNETPLATAGPPDTQPVSRDTVVDMAGSSTGHEPGSVTGQSAEPLVRAIKDELFRLSTGRAPVKHL